MSRQVLVAAVWLAAVAGILISGAVLICAGESCRIPSIDASLLGLLNDLRTNELDIFFAAITWLGSFWVLLLAAVLIAWVECRRSGLRASLFVPLSLFFAAGVAHLTKIIVERPRPDLYPSIVSLPADWSFPSAHAMQITSFLLASVLMSKAKSLFAKAVGATLIVLLVVLSRAYLQVHFPTDMLFGMLAAIACVIAAKKLTIEQRKIS